MGWVGQAWVLRCYKDVTRCVRLQRREARPGHIWNDFADLSAITHDGPAPEGSRPVVCIHDDRMKPWSRDHLHSARVAESIRHFLPRIASFAALATRNLTTR